MTEMKRQRYRLCIVTALLFLTAAVSAWISCCLAAETYETAEEEIHGDSGDRQTYH